jgi:hypothetical protein
VHTELFYASSALSFHPPVHFYPLSILFHFSLSRPVKILRKCKLSLSPKGDEDGIFEMKNTIPSDVWERKKALIAKLYKDEEWPLKQVIKQIRSDDFNPR